MKSISLTILFGLLNLNSVFAQNISNDEPLIVFRNDETNTCGYKNLNGDLVIPDKYSFCYTDTLHNYAAVADPQKGWIAIDKNDFPLYQIFVYDNGPDYESEGLFRIIIDELIGYADFQTGKIIIAPQYRCAYPFEGSSAKVAVNCRKIPSGEYTTWQSDYWYFINKEGKRIVNTRK